MATDAAEAWRALSKQVDRARFVPDTIWVDDGGLGFTEVSRHTDPDTWKAAVAADAPVITQINLGEPHRPGGGNFPSSSSSQPSIVADMLDALDPRPGDRVLEVGTGTGWNAALLRHRIGPEGRVTTIEVDAALAATARRALDAAGVDADVVVGDGAAGWAEAAPYDRIISTASVRGPVPAEWLAQLRAGGRLVTPWGTDWGNGALLTLDVGGDGSASGRFSGNLAFMRLRSHQRSLFGWEPDPDVVAHAEVTTTDVRGTDLDAMLNPERGRFAIGARLPDVAVVVDWDAGGPGRHVLELDDLTTRSYARVDADLTDPAPFTVQQTGPRRLWDEAVDAYDWWVEHGRPAPERLGLSVVDSAQTVWLDTPGTVVRAWPVASGQARPPGTL